MKLTTILLFFASLQVSAKVNAQEKVSLAIKSGSLETVLKEVCKQTGYLYVFQDHWKEKAKKIDISVTNVSVEDALAICFNDQPFTYIIIKRTIVVKEKEEKPQVFRDTPMSAFIDIHGRVVDENSQPAVGVTVTIKGTKRATSTDDNGEFSFKTTDKDAVLIFTSVNMEPFELTVNGDSDLSVKLKSRTKQLGEVAVVVNTGYQTIPKERATGSFVQVDNATLNQQVGTNILNRLDGVASGVILPKQNLQNGPAIIVRGLSTISGPSNPLIVLDNFPYDGDINNINPNDIENVTVLKDAAAASIWGTRAGNGVIVITTKKGRFNQPLKVGFSANVILTQKPDISSLRIIPSSDYVDVEQLLFSNGYYDSYFNNTSTYPAVSPVVEILAQQRAGLISPADATSQINAYRTVEIRDQYKKYLYQQAMTKQFAVNLHGGNENLAYYLSAGYDKNVDQLANASNRLTIRSENSYKPIKNLEIILGVQYTESINTSGKPGYGSVSVGQWQIPYLSFANEAGEALATAKNYRQGYTDTAGSGKLLSWKYYPLTDWQHNMTTTDQQDLLANVGLNFRVAEGLNFDLKYLYERQNTETKNLQDLQSYAARNMINQFSQIDPNSGNVTYIVPLGGILGLYNTSLESQNIRGQINYNHRWNNHNIAFIAGSEIRQMHTTGYNNTFYGYDDNILVMANVDYVNTYPTYINGNYSNIPSGSSLSDQLNRYVSYFANGAYTYNNKYTISASGRRDASNLFGVTTNNKWNPLWSTGAAWLISNESFYHIASLPFLKLRATYGFTGNTDPTRTGVVTLVYNNPQPPTNLPFTRVNQFPDPDLRWEKVKIINVGLDFQSKKQIITGTLEWYIKKGIDLFGAAPFDPTAGLNGQSSLTRNIANMEGKGGDITLTSKNFDNKVKWYTTLLFSYNIGKTTKYYVDTNLLSSNIVSSGQVVNPLVGQPLYSIIAFRWAGLDVNGNPQGYVNKNISTDYTSITQNTPKEDLIYKPALPVYFGNLTNTFSWKGFSMIININYRLGYYFLKPSINYSGLFNGGATFGSSDFSRRWKHAGDEKITNVPSMIYPANSNRDLFYNFSEILIDKADNIKLQYINLSYDFDKAISKRIPIKLVQLYINASNLGILWRANKEGIDPDYITSIRPGKTYALGLRANF